MNTWPKNLKGDADADLPSLKYVDSVGRLVSIGSNSRLVPLPAFGFCKFDFVWTLPGFALT